MKNHNVQKYLAIALTACAVIAFAITFYFCFDRITGLRSFFGKVKQILMPIIWGIIFAYLLTPIYNYLHRNLHPLFQKKFSEKASLRLSGGVSIFLSLMLLVAIIYALLAMIIPQMIDSIQSIVASAPSYVYEVRKWLGHVLEGFPEVRTTVISIYNSIANRMLTWANEQLNFTSSANVLEELLPEVWKVVSNVSLGLRRIIVFLKNVIIGFIVAIYLLAAKKKMCGQMKKLIFALFRTEHANGIIRQCRFAHKTMSGFVSGKLLDSLIIGVICFIGTSILKIPYAMLVSVVVGVTNIIPFFGPFIGAIPCALFILLNSPIKCLTFVIFIIILQQFDGNILGPKILGESTGLSSFWVIFALLLFGGLFGIVGMVLGVPAMSVIFHLVDEGTRSLLKRRRLSPETKDYLLVDYVKDGIYYQIVDPAFKPDYKPKSDRPPEKRDVSSNESSEEPVQELLTDDEMKADGKTE